MTLLITMDEALAHLRVMQPAPDSGPDDDEIIDIGRKVDEASAIVLDFVTHPDKAGWDEDTAPSVIKAAVKLVLAGLFEDRVGDPLTAAVKNVLRRYRDPSLA